MAAVSNVVTDGNATGIAAFDEGTQVSFLGTARVGGSSVTLNGTGLSFGGVGTFESFGDNLVRGNTTDTAGTITVVGKT